MRMKGKTLIVVLAVILSLTLLIGCGNTTTSNVSDTVRWINATCAILTENNSGDHNLFGGMKPGDVSKQATQMLLENYWDVTDKKSADETLDWILSEGHRTDFLELMQLLKEVGAEKETKEDLAGILGELEGDKEAGPYLAQSFYDYLEFGDTAIDAWDYSRAISLLGWYYLAGYYTETEALDKALEVAQIIQKEFSSWDEFNQSYCRGYSYWAKDDSSERWAIYEKLKSDPKGPFQMAWDTELKKTW